MPQSPGSTPADDLQFNTVEPAAGTAARSASALAPLTCAFCGRPLTSVYYALRDKVTCPVCVAQVMEVTGDSPAKFITGALLGLGGGLIGTVIWYVIRVKGKFEISLVAILIGYLVARGIRKGSRSLGGRHYQILAVVLTYLCIVANYAPDVFAALQEHSRGGQMPILPAVIATILYSLAFPFLDGVKNAIGILIIGFGLYQAWRMTARAKLLITGPYQVAANPQSAAHQGYGASPLPGPIADPAPDSGGQT